METSDWGIKGQYNSVRQVDSYKYTSNGYAIAKRDKYLAIVTKQKYLRNKQNKIRYLFADLHVKCTDISAFVIYTTCGSGALEEINMGVEKDS